MKAVAVFAASLLLSLALGGCDETCDPEDFEGGARCTEDRDEVELCLWHYAGFFLTGSTDFYLETVPCPSYAPSCVDRPLGGVVCKGELIGECSQLGFVRCEDVATMISCFEDEAGRLYLSRGVCAPGGRCFTGEGDDRPSAVFGDYESATWGDKGCYPAEASTLGNGIHGFP